MDHCKYHSYHHAGCIGCRAARRREEESASLVSSSIPDSTGTVFAAESIALDVPADVAAPDAPSGFDSNTNSGGDFGGGGSGGDY